MKLGDEFELSKRKKITKILLKSQFKTTQNIVEYNMVNGYEIRGGN